MTVPIRIQPHQLNCYHSFEVKYLFERCVKCKVYKWIWNCYLLGLNKVDIGSPGNWKVKELETEGGEK